MHHSRRVDGPRRLSKGLNRHENGESSQNVAHGKLLLLSPCHAARFPHMIGIMQNQIEHFFRKYSAPEMVFEPGQNLFHQGDPVRTVHYIVSGRAQLARHQIDGQSLVFQRASAGAVLAEASLFSDFYHCGAMAETVVHTLPVKQSVLRHALVTEPEFALAITRHMAHEIQKTRLQAEVLSLKTVAGRLDAWTVWQNRPLPTKGEWKILASQIGVSPEALYREMARRRPV